MSTWTDAADSLKRWFDGGLARLGALPPKRVTWGLVALFSAWVVLDVMVFKLTAGVAKPSYDAMVRARLFAAAPDPRLVIVDIDEASLARMAPEFGRWPWPRDTLATVLKHIEQQKPAAIVWDIVFSDPDRLNPGGDAAFNTAVAQSQRSHFSVVRLPAANDAQSQITQAVLPQLWAVAPPSLAQAPGGQTGSNATRPSTVALVAPALPAIAASRMGFNNGYVDEDGVLRRYRYLEFLPDGGAIQSIALSALSAVNPQAHAAWVQKARVRASVRNDLVERADTADELMAWRKHANSYPLVSLADVFAQAEGGQPRNSIPSLEGKVVLIGSTAPSLHDIHPTPLSSTQSGVDALATALDNSLNQRHLGELPRWLQAALAIAMCVALGAWVQFKSVASLAPALFALPAALLALSYLSLNGLPYFLDFQLAAALALVFLALLRVWSTLRRNYWCAAPPDLSQALGIWVWQRQGAWLDAPLDRLIDAVQRHAPDCRVVVRDANAVWPAKLRWPELARDVALVGPHSSLMAARGQLLPSLQRLAQTGGEPVPLDKCPDRENLAKQVLQAWSSLQNSATSEK